MNRQPTTTMTMTMKNALYITATINSDETTTIGYEVESPNGSAIATGSELLHDGGNTEIRTQLRSACVRALESRFDAEEDRFGAALDLPTAEEYGSITRGDGAGIA